ncbi:hypothetical protein [Singulisphaera sp. PoT]|uniref:hypothetical protein n=1 Tax=Singulisphaera sp. PoT TaxID=3411797 RepID=UPI003BF5EF32
MEIISSERNLGSAGGYSAILTQFLNGTESHIMLLDDDNVVKVGTTGPAVALLDLIDGPTAVYRPDRKYMRDAIQQGILRQNPPVGSVLGFDFLYTFKRAVGRGDDKIKHEGEIYLSEAPYSGLILPREVVKNNELPLESFFLYADDSEYTQRIGRNYKGIKLLPSLSLEEPDTSWNVGKGRNAFILKTIKGSNSTTLYYSIRNRIYLDLKKLNNSQGWTRNLKRLRFQANLAFVRLLFTCVCRGTKRFVLKSAIEDGLSGKLGKRELI